MKSIKSIITMLISIYIFTFWWLEVYSASSLFSWLETQIHSWSSVTKIKKMQIAMNAFWIYSWEINWDYKSVERDLLDYQKQTWLIEKDDDYWAWYFWKNW